MKKLIISFVLFMGVSTLTYGQCKPIIILDPVKGPTTIIVCQ